MKISLFGYGKTTRAIAENLVDKFGSFDIYDDHFTETKKRYTRKFTFKS